MQSTKKRRAFTLVELLVVIAIIAVLISILLPALSAARRQANTVACLANLRSIGQGLAIYEAEYSGWIPGSGLTTGAVWYLPINKPGGNSWLVNVAETTSNLQGGTPMHPNDWCLPIAQAWGMTLKTINDPNAGNRYAEYCSMPQFTCPAYAGAVQTPFTASATWNVGTIPAQSYVLAWAFLLTAGAPTPGDTMVTRISTGATYPVLPAGYTPRITKIGSAGSKIFCADGGKYSTATAAPDYNLKTDNDVDTAGQTSGNTYAWYNNTYGSNSNFVDFGPWSSETSAYSRQNAPGNAGGAAIDDRIFAYRHGGTKNGQFRMNGVFYDGHAETLDEMESANPSLWLPSGTTLGTTTLNYPGATGTMYQDVQTFYSITSSYVAP